MVLCTLWTAVGLDIFKERNEAVNLRLAPMMVQAEKEEGGGGGCDGSKGRWSRDSWYGNEMKERKEESIAHDQLLRWRSQTPARSEDH
jgi:hypothetical protein